MSGIEKHDFKILLEKSKHLIADGKAGTIEDLADILKISRNTLMTGFKRNFVLMQKGNLMMCLYRGGPDHNGVRYLAAGRDAESLGDGDKTSGVDNAN